MSTAVERSEDQFTLRAWHHVLIFIFVYTLLISRSPDALFHARFWAEDGSAWYAGAYNHGWWHELFVPWTGVFQTFPRLGAAAALLVPLARAPLLMNAIGIVLQTVVVNILLSRRSTEWGSLGFRTLLATAYVALPDCTEIAYGISPTAWTMALGAVLMVLAAVPRSWAARIFESIYLLLAGLTGPTCLMILPVSGILVWKRPDRWRWVQFSILASCSIAQLSAVFFLDAKDRPNYGFGASPEMLTRILSGNIFMGALLGRNNLAVMPGPGAMTFLICIAVVGLAIVFWCLLKSELEMKLFLCFTAMLLGVSLVRPTAFPPVGTTVWGMLAQASDIRYWFIPSLAFAWSLLWCARKGNVVLKSVSTFLLCSMCFGAAFHWRHSALKDFDFLAYTRSFEIAPPGTVAVIPENPEGWSIRLVKHDAR
jgi:hypothetical protein